MGIPLLCDSTTTTTTLEVFRPTKADDVDFFQLSKAPLSQEKEPRLIISSKGPKYEKSEKSVIVKSITKIAVILNAFFLYFLPRSETSFSGGEVRCIQSPPQKLSTSQKSVQWGETIAIQLPPSPTNSSLSLSPELPIQLPLPPSSPSPANFGEFIE